MRRVNPTRLVDEVFAELGNRSGLGIEENCGHDKEIVAEVRDALLQRFASVLTELGAREFMAPGGDRCTFIVRDGLVRIANPAKRISSQVTFEEARDYAERYPEPKGWPKVVRAIEAYEDGE